MKLLFWKAKPFIAPSPSGWIGQFLLDSQRILIVLPQEFDQLLTALPVLFSFKRSLRSVSWLYVVESKHIELLAGLLPETSVIGYKDGELLWKSEPWMKLQTQLQNFNPQISIDFSSKPLKRLAYLQLISGSALRISLCRENEWPFSNIILRPEGNSNWLSHFSLSAQLWNLSQQSISVTKLSLGVNPDTQQALDEHLKQKGLKAKGFSLLLWHSPKSSAQLDLLKNMHQSHHKSNSSSNPNKKPNGHGEKKIRQSIAILAAPREGNLPEELLDSPDYVIFRPRKFSQILGVLQSAAQIYSFGGWALHLAALTDSPVLALLLKDEQEQNTSWLNTNLKIQILDTLEDCKSIDLNGLHNDSQLESSEVKS